MTNTTLSDLNDALFKTLYTISAIKADDENFQNEKQKAETIYNIADRIIDANTLALRNEVWQHTKRFQLQPEIKKISLIKQKYEDDSIA